MIRPQTYENGTRTRFSSMEATCRLRNQEQARTIRSQQIIWKEKYYFVYLQREYEENN